MADEILLRFQRRVYDAVKNAGWDGRNVDVDEMKWSFAGSMLYSITVITTIGYGHITPKTDLGKLVTIFYALIGIPLTLLCLSNIGSAFAHCFRFLYYHLCKSLSCLGCKPPSTYAQSRLQQAKRGAEDASHPKRSVSYCGRALYAGSSGGLNPRGQSMGQLKILEKPMSSAQADDPGVEDGVDTADVRVPVTISLIIMALYILGGAVLFSLWEKEWTYLIGAYFCFITLSTIGFGDYVFGVGSDFATNQKTIICALYLVLGLSIIAMCFNLMQEEVRAKSRWLGAKLGIIDAKGSSS